MKLLNIVPMMLVFSVLSCRPDPKTNEMLSTRVLIASCVLNKCSEIKYSVSQEVKSLPEGLIISPDTYRIDNISFITDQEGLLRILCIDDKNYQRVVFSHDTIALISAISWIITHGDADKSKTIEELTAKAMSDKLYLTCGPASKWAKTVLNSAGINAREVMTITLEPWNNYDDGHNMIEVEVGGVWKLFDIDNGKYFTRNGIILNLLDFAKAVENDDYEMVPLSNDIPVQSEWNKSNGYDLTFFSELKLISDRNLNGWYKRVINAVLIESDGMLYSPALKEAYMNNRILSYTDKIVVIDSAQFFSKFYGSN